MDFTYWWATKDMNYEARQEFDAALDDIRHYEERERERKRTRLLEVQSMMANSPS